MINAEVFKQIFGIYATELWAMSESDFLEWLNAKHIATESRPKDAWIPCSERLPNEEGYYLVTRKNPKGHVTRVRFNPEVVERGVYNSPWGNGDCDILAWMPLPKPYGGDD